MGAARCANPLPHIGMWRSLGHFVARKRTREVLDSWFYWPTLNKDAYEFFQNCVRCQHTGRISARDEMPQNISDSYSRSTYKIESEMLKFEETKRAKMEQQCRAVMMTDLTKPHDPFEVEDPSTSTIIIVNKVRSSHKKNEPDLLNLVLQKKEKNKKKKKTNPPKVCPEIYVIKIAKGKYRWWQRIKIENPLFLIVDTHSSCS